jgi:hypothetical protein
MSAAASQRAARRVFIWTLSVGVVLGAIAFGYKLAALIFTVSSPDFRGTFDVGITVYFFVSAGWLCLLVWSFLTGKLTKTERSKHDLLRLEEEYERRGI